MHEIAAERAWMLAGASDYLETLQKSRRAQSLSLSEVGLTACRISLSDVIGVKQEHNTI